MTIVQAADALADALGKIVLCAKCKGDGYWLYFNSDGSGADRYDCACLEARKALAQYREIRSSGLSDGKK